MQTNPKRRQRLLEAKDQRKEERRARAMTRGTARRTPPKPRARASERADLAPAGYAGMPRTEWSNWGQVVDTFLAERPARIPEVNRQVLQISIGRLESWAALLAGQWLAHAPLDVLVSEIPGFAATRTLALIERFFDWLYARSDLDRWQYDVLMSSVDEARASHGRARKRSETVKECVVREHDRARIAEEFASTLEEHRRPLARALLDLLSLHFKLQLGSASPMPLGSLDADAMLAVSLDAGDPAEARDNTRIELTAFAMLYRWLGDTDRLEPRRAQQIAAELARAALAVGSVAMSAPSARA